MKKLDIYLGVALLVTIFISSCDLTNTSTDPFTITITHGANGSVSPNGTYSVELGQDATVDIAPDPGYVINEIYVDGKLVPSTNPSYTFYKVKANHTLYVSFKLKEKAKCYILVETGIGGTVAVTPSTEVLAGESVSFKPIANEGYENDKVFLDGVEVVLVNGIYTIAKAEKDYKLSAFFKEKQKFTITATAGVGGTIDPIGEIRVESGKNIRFTPIPDPGYMVNEIIVDNTVKSTTGNPYYLNNVDADHKIDATFKKTMAWYVMQKPFDLDSISTLMADGTWYKAIIYGVSGPLQHKIYFLPGGKINTYLDGVLASNQGEWSVTENGVFTLNGDASGTFKGNTLTTLSNPRGIIYYLSQH